MCIGICSHTAASPGDSGSDGLDLRRVAGHIGARGWHNETAVSPDYETAALLLLLQQDMLAYLDGGAVESTVVVGAGITPAWLSQPMAVSNLALPGGSITWQWDGRKMRVTLRGPARKIQLGSAFPPGTELSVVQKPLGR